MLTRGIAFRTQATDFLSLNLYEQWTDCGHCLVAFSSSILSCFPTIHCYATLRRISDVSRHSRKKIYPCPPAMESLVYKDSPLADYLEGTLHIRDGAGRDRGTDTVERYRGRRTWSGLDTPAGS